MLTEEDKTAFERQLAYIQGLPDGEQKTRLLEDLSRDYAGRGDLLSTEYAQAQDDLSAALDMPTAQVAGPSSNPFAIAVAPDITQYAAQGLRAYDANKRRKTAREGLEALSQGKERGLGGVMGAGASQRAMADTLRGSPSKAMTDAGFGRVGRGGSTADQYLEWLRRQEEEMWG